MPLVNVKKKVAKAGAKVGLEPGEQVLAGCTTNPSGTMKRMMAREAGGLVAAAIVDRNQGDASAPGALADRFVAGQNFVVVTDRRVLLIKMGVMTGAPKELLASWAHAEVAAITVDSGTLAHPFTVTFSDGSAVQVEGARGSDPGSVGEAFAALGH